MFHQCSQSVAVSRYDHVTTLLYNRALQQLAIQPKTADVRLNVWHDIENELHMNTWNSTQQQLQGGPKSSNYQVSSLNRIKNRH